MKRIGIGIFLFVLFAASALSAETPTEVEGLWFHVGRVAGGPGVLITMTFKNFFCLVTLNATSAVKSDVIDYDPTAKRFKLKLGTKITAFRYKVTPHYLILYTDDTDAYPSSEADAKKITMYGRADKNP